MIERRRVNHHYYELCRVASFHTYSQEDKQQVAQYYFDNSLSREELSAHYKKHKEEEESQYISPKEAEEAFRNIAGSLYGRRH